MTNNPESVGKTPDVEWLHRFINCAVFGPPPEEIQKAHQIVDELSVLTERIAESESQKLGWQRLCEGWMSAADKARQPDAFYEEYSEAPMRAMQALMTRANERAEAAELALEQARAALEELVACKDLHDRLNDDADNMMDYEYLDAEYKRRKPLAWEAARKFLSTQQEKP